MQETIIIIDIENEQQHYAQCLDFMNVIAGFDNLPGEQSEEISKCARKMNLQIAEGVWGRAPRYLEEPINSKEDLFTQPFTLDRLMNMRIQPMHFHIRIHLKRNSDAQEPNYSEFVHFQYLALMLMSLDNKGFFSDSSKIKISAFIVPFTGDAYPFEDMRKRTDYDTYKMASHYLRLMSKRYTGIIYGVTDEQGKTTVEPLDFHKATRYEDYFPVIPIDAEQYGKLFVENLATESYRQLFALRGRGRFENAMDQNPLNGLGDICAEAALKHIRIVLENHKMEDINSDRMQDIICDMVVDEQNKALILFCLFAYMLNLDGVQHRKQFEEVVRNTWNLASNVYQGLRQIVQNSVQYSQLKTCIFSFCLHKSRDGETRVDFRNRMGENYPNTEFVTANVNGVFEALEIFVSDWNENEDMLDNFESNLKEEIKVFGGDRESKEQLIGHRELLASRNQLAVRNFFSDYKEEDCKQAWVDFRRQDLVAHVGLSLLALTAKKCKASVKVLSNKQGILEDSKFFFYKTYSSEICDAQTYRKMQMIPGTQIALLIPVNDWIGDGNYGLGQLIRKSRVLEDYASFAEFIDYKEFRDPITYKNKEVPENRNRDMPDKTTAKQYSAITNPRKKNQLVVEWRDKVWKKHIREDMNLAVQDNYVFNHDFSLICNDPYFASDDYMEVCLKGLIGALSSVSEIDEKMILALTNLPAGFVNQFCKIALLLGVRELPTNLQLCLCEKNLNNMVVLIGENFAEAIYNSYILSMENGMKGFRKDDYVTTKMLRELLLVTTKQKSKDELKQVLRVFPFDAVLRSSEMEYRTIFEERIQKIAENPLDQELVGYKLDQTHMRLGSKVHIESFYEMSFLFYRTTIANRIAFLILRRLAGISKEKGKSQNPKIDLKKVSIIFYGYASYSKAILTSVTEILRLYREENDRNSVAFASYQHNLQAESEKIQMYFGLPKKFKGNVDAENRLSLKADTYVVQIVPISSTLTTFDKMWLTLQQQIHPKTTKKIRIYANYTVFWVVDSNGDVVSGKPSGIEEKYWEKVEGQTIQTKFSELDAAGCKDVKFFMRNPVGWHDPLRCDLCYPDKVLEEIPLVETDVTSTVPSQQIRPQKLIGEIKSSTQKKNQEWQKKNNVRLLKLADCVLYGHICRRQNHYQYYIDTQKYFYKVKDDVMDWLKCVAKEGKIETDIPTLHIIFSPEHNTNVGFAQYVNTYYFNGMAEVVSLNVDKEFRSNFICEHGALIKTIQELHEGISVKDVPPVRFYFVDDTIISGETFEKANSFLHSLIPMDYKDMYQANLFHKVFLLVDRNSIETKSVYVSNQQENFLSFVHIDVSNVRTQGDSCIGCKLEQNARRMFKRSATTTQAAYWATKIKRYQRMQYDDRDATKSINKRESFHRLLITHVLQNLFVKSKNAFEVGEAYQMLLTICLWMLTPTKIWEAQEHLNRGNQTLYGYAKLLNGVKGTEGVKIVLKVVCRPFFLFDFKIRKQILTFYIFWTELLLGKSITEIIEGTSKLFLYEENRIDATYKLVQKFRNSMQEKGEKEIVFLRDYLLEGLADMGSTYLLRKQTLKNVYNYLEEDRRSVEYTEEKKEFWNSYVANIQRLLTNSADETKELCLEYLYLSGMEYKEFQTKYGKNNFNFKPVFLYETISGRKEVDEIDYPFYHFCHDVFFHNMGVNFDGLEKKSLQKTGYNTLEKMQAQEENVIREKYEYFMEYWTMMRKLDLLRGNEDGSRKYPAELQLFNILKEKRNEEGNNESVDTWYDNLLIALTQMIHEKYDIDEQQINIAVITENIDESEYAERIQSLNIVKERLNLCIQGAPTTRYEIRNRIIQALKKEDGLPFELERNGYTINEWKGEDDRQEHYVIIFFDNPNIESEEQLGRSLKKIERVFLYIGVGKMNFANETENKLEKQNFYLKMILRDILSYRNRVLKFLESDFSGEIFSQYARTVGEKNIVSHEKANSHNTTADDEVTIEMFIRPELVQKYRVLDELQMSKWLLLRNYTNGQIAKMFNRSFATIPWERSDSDVEIPPLYVDQESTDGIKELFCQKLDGFLKLGICGNGQLDKRFEFLQQVVDIVCENMDDAEFIMNGQGEYYNLEYFKCIIIDICISAIKYASSRADYLLRVDYFLHMKKILKEKASFWKGKEPMQCQVQIFRETSNVPGVDYLVFRNPVDKFSHELDEWREKNKAIQRRLTDPLDFIDGHMSLLTIKRYVENIDQTLGAKCVFQYVEAEDDMWKLFFETKLPVLKEKNYGANGILD